MAGVYKGLTIKLGADTTGLSSALNRIDSEARGLKREMNAVNKALKLDPKNTDLARQKMEVYQKEIQGASERLKTLKEAEAQIGKDNMSSEAWNTLQREIASTQGKLGSMTAEYKAFTVEQAAASSGLGKAGAALTDLSAKLEPTATALESVGGRMSAAITAPAVAAGTASVKIAMDFESSLAKVSTLADESAMSMDKIGEGSRELAVKYGKSASEINEALYQAMSASIDTAHSLEFVDTATRLSKAGFTESATAVDVLTTAINAYGMTADKATHISDVLVNTQNLGKTTVNELASSMGNVIPTAAAYGVNLENLASAYAVMTKQGINTANATTAINGMLTELANNGSDVNKILQEMTGKTFGQMMKDGASLGDVMAMLNEHVEGDSEAFANLWGNVRASKGALALANAGADEFNGTLNSMVNSAGIVDKAMDKLGSTTQASINKAKAEVEDAAISVGQVLLPYVGEAARIVKGAADAFNSLSDGEKEAIVRTATLAAGIGPALVLLSKAMGLVGTLGGQMTGLAKKLAALDLATNGTAKGFSAAAKAGEKLEGKAMAASVAMGGAKAAAVALAAVAVGVLVSAINSVVAEQMRFENATRGLHDAVDSLGKGGSLEATSASTASYAKSVSEAIEEQSKLTDEISKSFAETNQSAGELDFYRRKIEELAGSCDGDALKMAELKEAVEGYNGIAGTSISIIDEQSGAIDVSTRELERNTEAWKNNAFAQAAQDAAKEVAATVIKNEMALERATEERMAAEEAAANASVEEAAQYIAQADAKRAAEESMQKAYDESVTDYEMLTNKAEEYRKKADELTVSAQTYRDALVEQRAAAEAFDSVASSLGMDVEAFANALRDAGVDAGEFAHIGVDGFNALYEAAEGDFGKIAGLLDTVNNTGLNPKHLVIDGDGAIKANMNLLDDLDRQELAKKGFEVSDDGTIKKVRDELDDVDKLEVNPTVGINDQASEKLDSISRKVNSLDGATVTVQAQEHHAAGGVSPQPIRVARHASGGLTGVVRRATVTTAGLVGEDGAEYVHDFAGGTAIVPIQNSRYVRPLAHEIAREMGGSTVQNVTNINVNGVSYSEGTREGQLVKALVKALS